MDLTRFDRLAITVGQRKTRRTALSLLTALGLAGRVSGEALATCLTSGKHCGGGRGLCCSGVCKGRTKTCRCPQRLCCECHVDSNPSTCTLVSSDQACQDLCAKQGASSQATYFPDPGLTTLHCGANKFCASASCVP